MDKNEDLGTLWLQAFKAYEEETGGSFKPDPSARQLMGTEDLGDQIEAEGIAFRAFRRKHHKLWGLLKAALGPVVQLGNVAQLATSTWPPAAAVLGSVLALVKSCGEVSKAYDCIESLFEGLQAFTKRLEFYMKSSIDPSLKETIVQILICFLRIVDRSRELIKSKRTWTFVHRSLLGEDTKTHGFLDRLDVLTKREGALALASTYAFVKEQGEDVRKLASAQEQVYSKIVEVEEEKMLRNALANTSAHMDADNIFSNFRKDLLEGSGSWLEKEPLFTSWIDQKASGLWVFGGPGCGKSHLVTWTIIQLFERFPQNPENPNKAAVAYFYVKQNNEVLRNPNNILKTFAWQIQQVDVVFRKRAIDVCRARTATLTAEDTWKNLFDNFYNTKHGASSRAILVLDGLDEAESPARRKILAFFHSLSNDFGLRIQFAIFGRPDLRDDVTLAGDEKYTEVSRERNQHDIDRYVQKRMEEVEILQELRSALPPGPEKARKDGEMIKRAVLRSSDGVFLWAQLVLDQILHKDMKEIKRILQQPSSLDDMIWSLFEHLANDADIGPKNVAQLLSWTAFARRPLKFGELDLMLRFPSSERNFLLWKRLRGRLASLFALEFPRNFDPDSKDVVKDATDAGDELAERSEPEDGEDAEEGEDGDSAEERKDLDAWFNDDNEDPDSANNELDQSLAGTLAPKKDAAITDFSAEQLETVVSFRHQRFRQYLVQEGNPSTRLRHPLDINVDVQRVHIDITKACLKILLSKNEARGLLEYPSKHFVWHLESIDESFLRGTDKYEIVHDLYSLFNEECGLASIFHATRTSVDDKTVFFQTWLLTDHHTRVVRAWFRDLGHIASSFDQESFEWMQAAALSSRQLLKSFATSAEKAWLLESGLHAMTVKDTLDYLGTTEFCVHFLHGYDNLDDNGRIHTSLKSWSWDISLADCLSADRIQHLADAAGLEKVGDWHMGLAFMLTRGNYYDQAISQFNQAIALDPTAWGPYAGAARCYGNTGRYREALSHMDKCLERLPNDSRLIASLLFVHAPSWKRAVGDQEGAVADAGDNPESQQQLIRDLHQANNKKGIMEMIERFGDHHRGNSVSCLADWLLVSQDVDNEIGEACRALGRPRFVTDAIDLAMKKSRDTDMVYRWIIFPGRMALFRYSYFDETEEPIRLLESALTRTATKDPIRQRDWMQHRRSFSNMLAQLYFDEAVAAQAGGAPATPHVQRLKDLASVKPSSLVSKSDSYSNGYASMLYGRWSKAEGHAWRKFFNHRIREEMSMLDDEDPTNDTQGLKALAFTLLVAGDRENAGAILAVLFKPLEEEGGGTMEGSASTSLHKRMTDLKLHVQRDSWRFTCDACGRHAQKNGEMHFCDICLNKTFCGYCLPEVGRPGQPGLRKRQCNPNHSWYQAWPTPHEAAERAAGLGKEWLAQLRSQWLR